jgi:hypothetical protein
MRSLLFALSAFLLFVQNNAVAQCSGGTLAGSLTPTTAYQTQSVISNTYYNVDVSCGSTYNFTFCSANGGSATWDTQITILNNTGTTTLAYNDDFCGLQSSVSYTATSNTTIRVLINQYNCSSSTGNTGTLAHNTNAVVINPTFTLTSASCTGATASITGTTGGIFTFDPVPGDGASINASTGAISNGTSGSTYTVRYTVCSSSTTQNVTLISGNPAFTLSPFCGGATATITGTSGGTFSFNPLPGDGAQINSVNGMVTNGTAGSSYSVQYTVCGSSSIQSVVVFTDDCFSLSGSATYIAVSGEDCIQLTAEVNNQTGCAWNGSQVDFNSSFSLSLDYYFGNNVNGADGNTFTFQPSSSTVCGQNGAQLGIGGIPNALVVEFDTYDNDGASNNDLSCDHISVEIDGDLVTDPAISPNNPPYCGPVCAKVGGGNIDDGGVYEVEIVWDATVDQLSVYFDGNLRLSCSGDFVNTVFGGQNMVYWGATSATGGLNNQQFFCPSTVVVLPAEMISFSSECLGEREMFTWVTASENRVDHFELEYTLDGMIFYPVGKVAAAGNSTLENTYSFEYIANNRTQKYFRIKTVDQDGYVEVSDLISGKNCVLDELLMGYTFGEGSLSIRSLSEAMEISLVNTAGQELGRVNTENAAEVQFNDLHLSKGVYLLNLTETKSGRQKIYRIYN